MKLDEWLDQHKVKRNAFAGRIGVTPQTITGYCDGSFSPSMEMMAKIAAETAGAVMPNDFLPAAEAAE